MVSALCFFFDGSLFKVIALPTIASDNYTIAVTIFGRAITICINIYFSGKISKTLKFFAISCAEIFKVFLKFSLKDIFFLFKLGIDYLPYYKAL